MLGGGVCIDPVARCVPFATPLSSTRELFVGLAAMASEPGPPTCDHAYMNLCEEDESTYVRAFGELGEFGVEIYRVGTGECIGRVVHPDEVDSATCTFYTWTGPPELMDCASRAYSWIRKTAPGCDWAASQECAIDSCIVDFTQQ